MYAHAFADRSPMATENQIFAPHAVLYAPLFASHFVYFLRLANGRLISSIPLLLYTNSEHHSTSLGRLLKREHRRRQGRE